VCAIGTDRVADKGLERKMGEVLSAQGKEMSEIKSNIAALSTQNFPHFSLQTLICNSISPYCAHPGFSPVVRPRRYLFNLPSRISPKGGPIYSLRVMLEPPHSVNSLLYVFRSDIRGITPGLFIGEKNGGSTVSTGEGNE
jgi:hypothetical protein